MILSPAPGVGRQWGDGMGTDTEEGVSPIMVLCHRLSKLKDQNRIPAKGKLGDGEVVSEVSTGKGKTLELSQAVKKKPNKAGV